MLDVVEVVLEFDLGVLNAGSVAVLDLRPAGKAGLHGMAHSVIWDLLGELVDELRAFRARADQTHVTFEDVPELGNFIQARLPQEMTYLCNARVVLAGPDCAGKLFGIDA